VRRAGFHSQIGRHGFRLQAGEAIRPPCHAAFRGLDGFVFSAQDSRHFEGLAGVAAEAELSCGGKAFRENVLFTHVGLSGPAALQASLYWSPGEEISAAFSGPLPRRLEQRFKALALPPMPGVSFRSGLSASPRPR